MKKRIGSTAELNIKDIQMPFAARIDTGATMSSLHAVDLSIEHEAQGDLKHNIGKQISFTTCNHLQQQIRVQAKIRNVLLVKSLQGIEARYIVVMHVGYHGSEFKVELSLRDRTKMDYKLLIGRNWLAGKFVVDVESSF
jgi:hypothetical protein